MLSYASMLSYYSMLSYEETILIQNQIQMYVMGPRKKAFTPLFSPHPKP
jgi:hypothetical protein